LQVPATDRKWVQTMSTITTKDGVDIFYKDWGPKDAQPIVFHHGWPLSSDDWDNQMLFFPANGYRVVGIDRRGHGRSTQVSDGHDMDHYAADAAAVVEHLDLRNAVQVGHSTGGGEATRYVARHGQPNGRVAKLVLIGAVPPIPVACRSTCSMGCASSSPTTARSSTSIFRPGPSIALTAPGQSRPSQSSRTGGARA
jgi:pimeloyl-ACP methyl ester carboxylesterase